MSRNVKIISIITFFLFSFNMKKQEKVSEDYEVYVNQIISSFSREMKSEYNLDCCGSGGQMPHDVEKISIGFSICRRASIEEARELEVKVTEKFIQAINAHEKIRPYLREYPFKANRAEIAISFKKPNYTQYTDGSVAYVYQVKNKIFYNADSESSPQLISLMNEPYEEALKIVRGSSSNN